MKKLVFILVIISSININFVMAQEKSSNCSCCNEYYDQFDFWLGEWDVFGPKGTLVGTNTIKKQYNNCLIQENWVSTGKNRGTSYNFYDKNNGLWNQIWIDNTGFVLKLKGNLIANSMILKSSLIEEEKGKFYNQISWTMNEDGTVTQLWEIYNEKNSKTDEAFRGIYKKRLN